MNLISFADHLWQSTLFAAVAGLLTLALRRNHARLRHSIWLAASFKFLIPLSVLIALGSHLAWRTPQESAPSNLAFVIDNVSQPFTAAPVLSPIPSASSPGWSPLPAVLFGIWVCGFIGITCSWWLRWRRIRVAVHAASPVRLEMPVRTMCSPTLLEPGVFGIFRPILLLPEGIFDRLTPAQLQAVIAHELCHIRHRDNLIAAIHMFVETVFWFHPLVWWIGKRMVEERERACDEEVLTQGGEPLIYAEAILNVCKLYAESPLQCVSGVTGADLKKRIEAIVANRSTLRLNLAKKVTLVIAGMVALVLPIAIGMTTIRAQSPPIIEPPIIKTPAPPLVVNPPTTLKVIVAEQPATPPVVVPQPPTPTPLAFEVVSIKASAPGFRVVRSNGGPWTNDPELFTYENCSLKALVEMAYEVPFYRVAAPDWAESTHFVVQREGATGCHEGAVLSDAAEHARGAFQDGGASREKRNADI